MFKVRVNQVVPQTRTVNVEVTKEENARGFYGQGSFQLPPEEFATVKEGDEVEIEFDGDSTEDTSKG